MGQPIDIAGQRFGRLVAIALSEPDTKNRRRMWRCACDCGETVYSCAGALRAGQSQSCGCLQRDVARQRSTTHGGYKSKLYRIWFAMLARCENETDPAYRNYGARGITVCERWHDFSNFRADMGEKPPRMTLERNDNDGPYRPDNCRWATYTEQQNNKRTNVRITIDGRTQTCKQWAVEFGINPKTASERYHRTGTIFPQPRRPYAIPKRRDEAGRFI